MENTHHSYDYANRFGDISERVTGERKSPTEYITEFEKLIGQITEGYNWEKEELENDLESTISVIENVCKEESLDDYEEHSTFKKIINHLYQRLIKMTVYDSVKKEKVKKRWPVNILLKSGGERYINSLSEKQLKIIKEHKTKVALL